MCQAPKVPQLVGDEVLDPSLDRRISAMGHGGAEASTFVQVPRSQSGKADDSPLVPSVAETEEGGTFLSRKRTARHQHHRLLPVSAETAGHGLLRQLQKVLNQDLPLLTEEVGREGYPETLVRQPQERGIRCFPDEEGRESRIPGPESGKPQGPVHHRPLPTGEEEASEGPRHSRAAG